MTLPIRFQRIESGIILVVVATCYYLAGGNWLMFALLILVPDISMLGYLHNSKVGAVIYNIGHSYMLPAALIGLAIITSADLMLQLALIWTAHIAMDRALGYGLKESSGFQDTHLGHIGKSR